MKHHVHYMGFAFALLIASMGSHAQIITNYGNFEASTVWYEQVSEETDIGMYGEPTIAGDTLSFNPLGLEASSSGGGPAVINDAQLNFDVRAKLGKYIAGFDFTEGGDFTLDGPGTDATGVDVTANFFVSIFEVDGSGIDTITENFSMTFTPNADGTFQLVTDAGNPSFPPYQGTWDGSVYIDLSTVLDDNFISYVDGVTYANINLDNILVAGSEVGTSSLIKKKFQNGLSVTSDVIPEPTSAVLIAGTAGLLALVRRRFIH